MTLYEFQKREIASAAKSSHTSLTDASNPELPIKPTLTPPSEPALSK